MPRVILFREEHTRRVMVPKVDFISAAGPRNDGTYRPGGPIAALAWGLSAVGVAFLPRLLRRWNLVHLSVALRLLQGATVIAMGLTWGPVGLIVAYLATYAIHIASGVAYETLMHEQVGNERRATVLSLASMAAQPAGSLGSVILGAIATGASTPTAMIVGGIVLAVAAPLFLVREQPAPVH